MKIDLPYDMRNYEKNGDKITPSEITLNIVTSAFNLVFKDGLEGQKRRIYNRILRKIDEGIEKKESEVKLEAAEIDFLVKTFNDANFPPAWTREVSVLEEEIDSLDEKK